MYAQAASFSWSARLDDVDRLSENQWAGDGLDDVVLERAQPVVIAPIADPLGRDVKDRGFPEAGRLVAG